jgi:hypothetical protein
VVLMAAAPLGISALGGWSLLEPARPPSSLTLRIAQGLLATVVFVHGT